MTHILAPIRKKSVGITNSTHSWTLKRLWNIWRAFMMNLEPMKYWNFRKFHHFLVKNGKFQIRIVCHMCAFQKFILSFHDLLDAFFSKPENFWVLLLFLPHQEAKMPFLVKNLHFRVFTRRPKNDSKFQNSNSRNMCLMGATQIFFLIWRH